MNLDQLKPNVIVRGPIFPEPVQVIVSIPMGASVIHSLRAMPFAVAS